MLKRRRYYWLYDGRHRQPDGTNRRVRLRLPIAVYRTQEEALTALARRLPCLQGGTRPAAPSIVEANAFRRETEAPTIAALYPRWLAEHVDIRNCPGERKTKRSVMGCHVLPRLGSRPVDTLTRSDVSAWLAKLAQETSLAPASCNLALAYLSSFYSWAVSMGLVHENPCAKVGKLRVPAQDDDVVVLTHHEEQAVLTAAKETGAPWDTMILVQLRAGLRISEALTVEVADVDLARGTLHVRRNLSGGEKWEPKSGSKRRIPLPTDAREAVRVQCDRVGSGALWPGKRGGVMSRKTAIEHYRRVYRAAGLPDDRVAALGTHSLRHTCATRLDEAQAPTAVIQKHLGHAQRRTTERYVHPNDEAHVAGVERASQIAAGK